MAFARWQATITDGAGNIVPNAQVEVRQEIAGSPLARLYSDRQGTVRAANPIAADEKGYVFFHVSGGAYRITATKGEFSREWRYVGIGRNSESDLAGLRPQGAWAADFSYSGSDYIRHKGRTFVSLVDENVGHAPPDAPADNEFWMWVPLGENAELAIEAREEAEAHADHAAEWAQSPNPISPSAGGDGAHDRSSKWHADRSGEEADRAAGALDMVSGLASAFIIAENTFATKAAAEAWHPAAAPDYIRTAGYAVTGDGGGALYRKAAAQPTHAGKLSITLVNGSTVVWYELAETYVTPQMFGAVSDGATDSAAALQAFFNFVKVVPARVASVVGDYAAATPLIVDVDQTRLFVCEGRIKALAAMDTLLTINNGGTGAWRGRLRVHGGGGSSYSERLAKDGIRITGASRGSFDFLEAEQFKRWGIVLQGGNSNIADLGLCRTRICGGSMGPYEVASTWSNPVNSGSTGSSSQRTTITVADMPPDAALEDNTLAPITAVINGEPYRVIAYDAAAKTLTLFPWVDSTLSSGSVAYIFGGGVKLAGADQNCVNINMADSQYCGHALFVNALYGPIVSRLVAQNCGNGFAVGDAVTDSHFSTIVHSLYCESNTFNVINNSSASRDVAVNGMNETSFAKVVDTNRARGSSDNRRVGHSNFFGWRFGPRANVGPGRNGVSTNYRGLGPSDRTKVYTTTSSNMTFTLESPDVDGNRIFGTDGGVVVAMGAGGNMQVTGGVVFNPPPGWTVNGLSTITFSGLTKPATFSYVYDYTSLNVRVAHIN